MNDLDPVCPGGAGSYDDLAAGLQELRVRSGMSYRELHRRVLRHRRQSGEADQPAFDTVYRCLQPGRRRLDPGLVTDIARVLKAEDPLAWRQACAALTRAEVAVDVTDLPPRRDLVGRCDALAALGRLLGPAAEQPAVVVTGMAGVGKTALVVEAAYRLRSSGGTPVCFVDLAGFGAHREPVPGSALVEPLLRRLSAGRERIPADPVRRRAELRRLLATRRVVVVLDNVRDEAQVAGLLLGPGAPSRVLVTSRNRLDLPAGLLALDVLSAAESAALLARGAGPNADPALLAELADRTGRLPLALSLLAGRIGAQHEWSLTDHLDQLRDLQAAQRLDPGVEASLRLSYAHLADAEQRLLRLVSQLPLAGVDAHLAAAVGGLEVEVAGSVLDRLVRVHLVQPALGDRFDLHDVVRLFLAGRALEEDPPRFRRLALERALDYLIAATAAARALYAPQLRPPSDLPSVAIPEFAGRAEATAWLDRQRADLLAAAESALAEGLRDRAVSLSTLLFTYLTLNQYVDDATRLYERTAAATGGAARAGALLSLAAVNGAAGRIDRVREPLESALAIYEELADAEGIARVVHNLGALCWEQGDYAGAEAYGLQALDLARRSQGPAEIAMTVDNLGILYSRQGRLADSMAHHEEALAIHRELGDQIKEGRSLSNLGLAATSAGRPDAEEILTVALAVSRAAGDRVGECLALSRLADVDSLAGRHGAAIERYEAAQAIIRDRSMVSDEALEITVGLSAALRRGDRLREAAAAQAEATELAREAGNPYWSARALAAGAGLAFALGERDAARAEWAAAAEQFARLGCPEEATARR